MKTLTVGDLKANFSSIIKDVKTGKSVTIAFGRNHEKVAVLIPYSEYRKSKKPRKIGILEGQATYKIKKNFKISDNDLLSL